MSASVFVPDLMAGQVAVVTGGGSGIGLAIASSLAAHGSEVVVAGRSADRLAAATASINKRADGRGHGFVCDVRDEDSVAALREEVISRYGTVTVVVNNAAANFTVAAERMSRRALLAVLDTDLVGTCNVTRAFIPDLIEDGGGVILNVVVPAADLGFPGYAHCGAAKAGIISLTRTWAREWGRHGVRVNAIGPGTVPTEGAGANMPGLADGTGAHARDRIALGRLGEPQDVAMAAMFLCSPAASWITGVVLNVDGGLNIA